MRPRPPGRPAGRRGPAGFTFIELVIVITIVGILAVAAAPAWMDVARNNLDVSKRRLITDLSYAREVAIQKHDPVMAKFDVAAGSYTIYRRSTGASLADPSDLARTLNFSFSGQDNSGGVALASVSIGGMEGLRFTSWGTPCDTLGNAIASTGFIILTSGQYTDTVRVEAKTGYVR